MIYKLVIGVWAAQLFLQAMQSQAVLERDQLQGYAPHYESTSTCAPANIRRMLQSGASDETINKLCFED